MANGGGPHTAGNAFATFPKHISMSGIISHKAPESMQYLIRWLYSNSNETIDIDSYYMFDLN